MYHWYKCEWERNIHLRKLLFPHINDENKNNSIFKNNLQLQLGIFTFFKKFNSISNHINSF